MLNELSKSLSGLVKKLEPSLVTLVGRRVNATGIAWGSGGLIATADHNLPRRGEPIVRGPDGTERVARVLGRAPRVDLALVQVPELELPLPDWADAGGETGELALSLARPGPSVRATLGLISATGGPWRSSWGGDVDRWIDVDGSLPMGFSGGPLVAADGRVLGLNTRSLVRGGTTLPTPTLRRVLEALATHGKLQQGWLGVGVQAVEGGLLVHQVVSKGPAGEAGVIVGDVLTELGGEPLGELAALHAALGRHVGQEAQLTLLRGGEPRALPITPRERPTRC